MFKQYKPDMMPPVTTTKRERKPKKLHINTYQIHSLL